MWGRTNLKTSIQLGRLGRSLTSSVATRAVESAEAKVALYLEPWRPKAD